MRAVISLRVSTDEQAEEGYSLAAQERACRHHCEMYGWHVVDVFADEGLSGTLEPEARPGLSAALDLIRGGWADALVVHKLDRLARSVRIANQLIEEFQRRGVAFVAVVDRIDLSTPYGWAAFQMQNVWNELYIKNLSFETAKGHREKAKQGGWVGPVPLGYVRDGHSLAPSDDAAIIVLIFQWYATGLESYISIADRLNALGHRTLDWKTGERGLFGRESVRTILQNRAYLGYVSSGGVEYPGKHPSLITLELWEKCTHLRDIRTRTGGVVKVQPLEGEMLAQLIYCAACGSRMHRYWTGRATSRTPRYRCSGPQNAGNRRRDCVAPMVAAAPIEEAVRALLCSLRVTPELRVLLEDEARQYVTAHQPRPHRSIERELRDLKRQFLDEQISAATYEERRAALLAEQEAAVIAPAGPSLEVLLALLNDLPTLLRTATRDEGRAIIRPVLSHIWIRDKGIQAVTPTAAFQPLLRGLWEVERRCPMGFEPTAS